MSLPILLTLISPALTDQQVTDLVLLNAATAQYGLELSPAQAQQILLARNKCLRNQGRVEIGIEVSRLIILSFSSSPYIHSNEYVETLCDLHDIFYDLKNETEDKISDEEAIGIMKTHFEQEAAGSSEALRGILQAMAQKFRSKLHKEELDILEDLK